MLTSLDDAQLHIVLREAEVAIYANILDNYWIIFSIC